MEDATHSAEKAIAYDKAGKYDAAIYFYVDAANGILDLVHQKKVPPNFVTTAEEYIRRAELLKVQRTSMVSANIKSVHQVNLERAEFLLYQALDADEAGRASEAVTLYSEAIELCLQSASSCDTETRRKLRQLAKRALERAEALKESSEKGGDRGREPSLDLPEVPTDELSHLNLEGRSSATSSGGTTPTMKRKAVGGSDDRLGRDELAVLATTSNINGRQYVPFLEVDLKERFGYPAPFTDKHGLLALAEKQKQRLKKWMRPSEIMQSPTIIEQVDSGTIKQTVVSDCSFIASLSISARYERRFGKRLVTRIIFPQNKHGEPIYNPCGKYMVKLHINGVWRKVIIDDLFPIGEHGDFLCSYSQNRNELWVSLLEKAYMKVMGGYDFPGSNSSIDMHALTGWIPERIAIRKDSKDFDADAVFEKLFTRFHQGHCLVTLATGKMSQIDIERSGLVDAHAYAVLDLRKALGKRMLLVKNPWTHLRWKGRYSEKDTLNWTPELCHALNYNPADAQQFDDGVFWIDYESVCHFFDVFYVNWDPSIFKHTYGLHAMWSAGVGPVKDLYTVADNPQYILEVNNKNGSSAVWILLTRHITDKTDFADNREFITVMVYKSGKKVYLPFDPKPLMEPIRINSPHYLCQMIVKDTGVQKYTLVVAQHEKMNTIYYTLRVYSTTEFRLHKVKVPYIVKKKEVGEWKGKTAGGCGNGPSRETYKNNPIYNISLDEGSDENEVFVELKGPKQYSVGFEVKQISSPRNKPFERRDSGAFRPGYTVLALESVPAGIYSIQPMTFLKDQEGPFFLTVEASCAFTMKRVQ
uniref:Calpain-7 n=1 Tax=Ascaris suum TaxID=6253 RepID=F1KU58_ASCSU